MAWDGELELVALRIPFGFSLVVEKGCIHGDSTFQGKPAAGLLPRACATLSQI